MLIDEVLPLDWRPYAERVPDEVRRRELDDRNTRNVLAWLCKVYGPVVGAQLAGGTLPIMQPYRREHWHGLSRPSKFVQLLESGGVDTLTFKRL